MPSGATADYEVTTPLPIDTGRVLRNYISKKTLTWLAEYDGSSSPVSEITTYNVSPTSTIITNPDGLTTTETFGDTTYQSLMSGIVSRTVNSNGNRTERTWAFNRPTGASGGANINAFVKTEYTTVADWNGSPSKTAIRDVTLDPNGNQTEVREYDWVAYSSIPKDAFGFPTAIPGGAVLKRKTVSTFNNSASGDSTKAYWTASAPNVRNAAASTEVQNAGGTPASRTELTYDNAATTANITETKSWDSFKGGIERACSNPLTTTNSVSTSATYNSYGMPLTTTDSKGVISTITYGYINGHYDLYPTQTVTASNYTAIKRTSTAAYDFYTGVVTSTTDVDNSNATTSTSYDNLGRPLTVTNPLGATTVTQYYDANRCVVVKSDLETIGDGKKVAIQHYDQLGRVRLSRTLEDSSTQSATDETHGIKVQTRYMTSGGYNYSLASNPYRASYSSGETATTMGWTRTKEWNTDRKQEVETFSGASLPAPWSSNSSSMGKSEENEVENATTTIDEAGKSRRVVEDALGRQIRVDEADANGNLGTIAAPNQATYYSYDPLGNLVQIVQGGQTRSFTFSSLSRLTSSTNPENGTFQYTYDGNGNLLTKTDARPVSTTFTYDALNRVTFRNYSDATPDVTYTYDNAQVPFSKGKLTKVSSAVSETLFTAYDAQERITGSQQITEGETHSFGYTYNLDDELLTQTYPSGKVVEFDYDASGDLERVGRPTGFTYASSFGYAPHGQVEKVRLGNDKWETTQFNGSRQITQIGLGHSATDTGFWKTNYEYGEWNGSTVDAIKNNGNLARQTTLVPTIGAVTGFTAVQVYSYDKLDRLKSATETISGGQTWKQTFLYDRFGNKNFDAPNTTTLGSCATSVCNPSASLSNNKLTGYGYDNAGNITSDAEGRTFAYDAENRQITATGSNLSMSYAYDGNGKRIKSHNSITNQTTVFVYDADGRLSAEYTINVPPPTVPTISYLTEDALGSPRVITNSFGEVKSRRDFFPFGEEIWAGYGSRNTNQKFSSSTDDNRQKFTGYQRDWETGLDFAQSRYYSSKHGRFTSPDEFKGGPDELFNFEEDASDNPTFYADLANPQSLNKYQYTYNNPYKYTDRNGHCPTCEGQKPAFVIPLLGPAIAAGVAILLGADYAVAPTGRETPEQNREYRRTGGNDALTNLIPFPMIKLFPKAFRSVVTRAGTKTPVSNAATKVAKSQRVKPPTKSQRKQVYDKNRQKNNGKLKCDNCSTDMVPSRKSQKGVKPPPNAATIDHKKPRSRGGDNSPSNLRGTCRKCNQVKSDN